MTLKVEQNPEKTMARDDTRRHGKVREDTTRHGKAREGTGTRARGTGHEGTEYILLTVRSHHIQHLTGLLFDMEIFLNEFIYFSGPVKKFSYHYILFQGAGLSYGALTTSNCSTTNRF